MVLLTGSLYIARFVISITADRDMQEKIPVARLSVQAEITGMVWKIVVKEGDQVSEDDVLLVVESMKMEIPLLAPQDGIVREILTQEGGVLSDGDTAIILEVS
ncbi:MAG TPA: acetyl-CoA carboxylase biotin carboxyl carrier protein subunit [Ktedonobacteraceae bacterium]|nr:acetyl-CoA carboxylase biotin carboxyl carrier protein subunit [Ktedonobacteraceae bacterium]